MSTVAAQLSYPGSHFDQEHRALVFPEDYRNPTPQGRYHVIVIGAGPAGLVTAIAAAGLGAKVALVERHAMGGDCLNVGCVPSKALLEFTRQRRGADEFDAAFTWLRRVRAGIAHHDSVDRFSDAGVDVFLGEALFIDDQTVQVREQRLSGRRVVIATGARASLPPIPGLPDADPLTNETVFDLHQRPASLAILGAGAIGCELAQVFARLDVRVHVFEMAPRVLPLESPAASELIAAALTEAGVSLHLGAAVDEVQAGRPGLQTVRAGNTQVQVERILVALGRRANTQDLNLDVVGVQTEKNGLIKVDRRLRTTNPRVLAAGDVCSQLQFTHNADAHARVAVQNALFAPTASIDKLVVPHCTYTDPELAQVGASAAHLDQQGKPFDRYRVDWTELDRGRTETDARGFAEVLTTQGGDRILGATLVGHDAGEQIAPICLMMSNGLGLAALGKTILPYPTRSEYLRRLGDAYGRKRLTPFVARLFKGWLKWLA